MIRPSEYRLIAAGIACVVSGLFFAAGPYLDRGQFAGLKHIGGKVEAVERRSAPGAASQSAAVILTNSEGKYRIQVEGYAGHPVQLSGLSLGTFVDAWVDEDPAGMLFVWHLERDGEVLVSHKDRLETALGLQNSIAGVGWPIIGVGALLLWLAYRSRPLLDAL